MKNQMLLYAAAVLGVPSVLVALPIREAQAQVVFQAAGPTAASIQATVDAFRAELGDPNNGNNPGPLGVVGRREINWDGGGTATNTTPPVTPFNTFLDSRGAQFTTAGTGLSQATPSGLAVLFNNPDYASIFGTFSPQRLFTPVGSRITEGLFFVPTNDPLKTPAVVTGFGAVFTDVDEPNGVKGAGRHSTRIEFFDANNLKIYTGFVPAAPGDASLSFFGVVFDDPIIARVRITTGDANPGVDDTTKDIVMMDDFIYGEPQALSED